MEDVLVARHVNWHHSKTYCMFVLVLQAQAYACLFFVIYVALGCSDETYPRMVRRARENISFTRSN